MQKRYIPQLDMTISPLGFGVMRLPVNADGTSVHRLLVEAYERGINYFDTAYPYLGGHSEQLIRDALVAHYPRASFHIADKMPVWDCNGRGDMERIFDIQLERLGVEYIDFYLLHGLHHARWLDIYNKGVLDFLDNKLKEGRIRKAGFSFHDTAGVLVPILNAYEWDFTLLQINYYDWTAQRASDCYDLLAEREIPCMVMEPVGGGRLAKLPSTAENLLKKVRPNDSIASWALRFTASLENVAVTLSGMSDMAQLVDNLSVFTTNAKLSEAELSALGDVVEILKNANTIPCTACGYCVDDCPKNIDIPQIFTRYNDYMQFENAARFDVDYNAFVPPQRRGSRCVSCGKCTEKCPQNIDIPKELKLVHNKAVGMSIGVDIDVLEKHLANAPLLICFGSGAMGRAAASALSECGFKVDYFCDNNEKTWGTTVDGVEVISPTQLEELGKTKNIGVLITSSYRKEISTQLESMGVRMLNQL